MSSSESQIAALFDIDGTIFSAQFGRGLLNYTRQAGRKFNVWLYYFSLLPGYLLYKAGLFADAPFLRLVMSGLARLLRGMDEEQMKTAFEWNVHQYLMPTKHQEVLTRLKAHLAEGHRVLLVSAQFQRSVDMFAELVGAEGGAGTILEVQNGRATGRIRPPVMTGEAKSRLAKEYFESRGIRVDWGRSWAYADSYTDREMLELAGSPVAVFPDEKLARLAREKGWEIITGPDSQKEVDGKN